MFHRHQWLETERTYAKPSIEGWGGVRMSEHMAERLLFGVTTVILTCQVCGDKKAIEALGESARNTRGAAA